MERDDMDLGASGPPLSSTPAQESRALSFGLVAEEYDRYRPELPDAVLDWLLPPGCRVALDLGAGTGAATRVLIRRVERVIALEPDPRMGALLRRRAPVAHVIEGRAEAIPLEDSSVDFVMVSSAWHWLDPARAVPEIARVLRPGGTLALVWNSLDRETPWVAELRQLCGQPQGEEDPLRPRRPERVRLPEEAPFGPPDIQTFRWTWRCTRESLRGLTATYSSVIVLAREEQAGVAARVRDFVASLPLEPGQDTLSVPMACRCWKAFRT